jgi:uncharacterized protein YciI
MNKQPPGGPVVGRKKFEFAILYTPGPAYRHDLPPQEQPVAAHQAYIEELRQRGILIQGGPFPDNVMGTDPRHGTPIISVQSDVEAQGLVAQDPGVTSGVLHAELHPWDIKFGLNRPF